MRGGERAEQLADPEKFKHRLISVGHTARMKRGSTVQGCREVRRGGEEAGWGGGVRRGWGAGRGLQRVLGSPPVARLTPPHPAYGSIYLWRRQTPCDEPVGDQPLRDGKLEREVPGVGVGVRG